MSIPKPKEADVVKAVLTYLTHVRRIPAWRNNSGATRFGKRLVRFGEPGSPDVIGLVPPDGVFLGVECKAPGGKLTDLQRAFGDLIRSAGGVYCVVRSLDDLIAVLDELDSERGG